MGAYADLNEFVNRCTGGNSGTPEFIDMHKEARVAGAAAQVTVAGKYQSLWQYEGQPAHGAAPGAVAAPTRATNGAWKQANPGGGRQKWMSSVFAQANAAGTLFLCDRLLHISGLSGTVITAQTVGGALTRNTGGVGNEIWAEIYTQIGATATTITASYTNQAAAAGQVTQAVTFGGTNNREAQRMIPLSLAAGDNGVQAVANCTVLASTLTAGDFGITVLRRLAAISISGPGSGSIRTFIDGPMTEVVTDACLFWMFLPQTAAIGASMDAWAFSTER